MDQRDVDRVQEFRKCIECFLCQNVCHVLRDHERQEQFGGPSVSLFASPGWRCIRSMVCREPSC